jgi:hypothetical protein
MSALGTSAVIFGGVFPNGDVPTDTWTWDGSAWAQAALMGPPPRIGHAMAAR